MEQNKALNRTIGIAQYKPCPGFCIENPEWIGFTKVIFIRATQLYGNSLYMKLTPAGQTKM